METRRNLNEKCILSLKTMRAHELASGHVMAQLSFIPAIAILIRYAFLAMHISYHSPSLCLLWSWLIRWKTSTILFHHFSVEWGLHNIPITCVYVIAGEYCLYVADFGYPSYIGLGSFSVYIFSIMLYYVIVEVGLGNSIKVYSGVLIQVKFVKITFTSKSLMLLQQNSLIMHPRRPVVSSVV